MTRMAFSVIAAAAWLGACSSNPPATPTAATATPAVTLAAPAPAPQATPPAPAARATPPAAPVAASALPAHLDPKSELSAQRSIYFDFDETLIRPEFARLIELHGKYLTAHPTLSIRVEGSADERGGAEYNLALGQRRAEAVRRALKVYGVADTRVEAVSWGEEKPKANGHDESAWAQNRRADLQYPAR
jgi:peptidoglycan-associated lipoprotein